MTSIVIFYLTYPRGCGIYSIRMEIRKLIKLGRSSVITIPKAFLESLELHRGDKVALTLEEDVITLIPFRFIIKPMKEKG